MRLAAGRATFLACAIGLIGTVQAAPPPVEAFGDQPIAETASLSPDGKHLAVIGMFDGRKKVEFLDLSKPDSKPFITGMQGGLPTGVFWKTDDLAIVTFHANLNFKYTKHINDWARAISVQPSAQRDVLLGYNAPLFLAALNGAAFADFDADDPTHVYMPFVGKWDYELMLDLFHVDLTTGGVQLALHTNPNVIQYVMDGYGHVLGRIEQHADLTNHVILNGKEVFSYDVRGGAPFELEGLTENPDPHFVVKLAHGDAATTGLYLWDGSPKFGPTRIQLLKEIERFLAAHIGT